MLTTGEAAKLCSVTPDTILKWIRKGKLGGVRTAGGHYRIRQQDIDALLILPQKTAAQLALPFAQCPQRPLNCWEYMKVGNGVEENCKTCVVYRMRASRCFEIPLGKASDLGHARRFCRSSCQDCVYYRRVNGLPTNVLVITSDEGLIERLSSDNIEAVVLRFAKSAYEASATIPNFSPAFVILDHELIAAGEDRLVDCLANDPRVPGLKIILVVPHGMSRSLGAERQHQVIDGVIEKPFGLRRIAMVINSFPVNALKPEEGNL